MPKKSIKIIDVKTGSIADELDIKAGDKLLSLNGQEVEDILEYRYLISDEYLYLEIEKVDGQIWQVEIEKDFDEDLGLVLESVNGEPKSCHNKCIFCFIDQLPKGMRKTLYFKDDDTTLSFLQGNFLTLTNMDDKDINRIIKYRISPINISIHTTDMELRKKMLNNEKAAELLDYMKKLKDGKIQMKGQIVLCPGINDGEYLDKTIEDLYGFYPELSCVAIVPVGLTKYREGLFPLEIYDKHRAGAVIDQVESMQKYYLDRIGTRFVFLSDEFYLIANREIQPYESYEDFSQLENGVGIIALFNKEIDDSLNKIEDSYNKQSNGTIVTGEYAMPILKIACSKIMDKFPGIKLDVVGIKNDFFGTTVKVSGLITGRDIIHQLKGKHISQNVYIPENMLRKGEEVFLDDFTIQDIEKELGIRVIICKQDGSDLLENIMKNCK